MNLGRMAIGVAKRKETPHKEFQKMNADKMGFQCPGAWLWLRL